MAETHPILEAAGKAAERAYCDARIAAISKARDHVPEFGLHEIAWRAAALAAARVILSAEPSDAQCDSAESALICGPEPRDEADAPSGAWAFAKGAIRNANAALLREIEGSVPPSRDVEGESNG